MHVIYITTTNGLETEYPRVQNFVVMETVLLIIMNNKQVTIPLEDINKLVISPYIKPGDFDYLLDGKTGKE